MPSKGSHFRAGQAATLASIYHHKLTDPDYGSILEDLQSEDLSLWEAASLYEAKRERDKAVKVPAELVREMAETASRAYTAWVKARAMIENFLLIQWKAGALAGATPEQAFYVKVGLGETMTALDVLEGRMIFEIGMAVVRPAEFIILNFCQVMPES